MGNHTQEDVLTEYGAAVCAEVLRLDGLFPVARIAKRLKIRADDVRRIVAALKKARGEA